MGRDIFEIDRKAIKHGNHVSEIDAEFCTQCGVDTAHPVFNPDILACADAPDTCPHRKPLWKIGDKVKVFDADGSMGHAVITTLWEHNERLIALLRYPKYDKDAVPCYRTEFVDSLIHYEEPEARAASNIGLLTFQALRIANRARMPLFKNATGETKHSGQDWTVSDWALATAGETGELAEVLLEYALMTMALGKAENIMKKMRRKDFDRAFAHADVASELADVQIYLDMLADSLGVDLGKAVIHKWNKKSIELAIPLRLTETTVERTDIEKL